MQQHMATGIFERELKGILSGDTDVLKKVTRTCDDDEKNKYSKIAERPFIVIRAAGSFGVDLVAIRGDLSFPIEVKTSSNKKIHFSVSSGRASKQAEMMIGECSKANLIPIYAYRLKSVRGDAWRIFTIDMENVKGILSIVHKNLPKLGSSKKGNFILKWDDGMPLNKFIDYICSSQG